MIATRRLGGTDLQVSTLGMGCSRLGAFWQRRSVAAGRRALEEAVDQGVTFFDTADSYARGISERLVGSALGAVREHVVICTKVGYLKTPSAVALAADSAGGGSGGAAAGRAGSLLPALRGAAGRSGATQCFTSQYVERAAERSLRRLGTDHLDVLLLHSPPYDVIVGAAFSDAVGRLRQAGKVRHFGISCDTTRDAMAALASPGLDCLELAYNPLVARAAAEPLAEAERRGVGVIARSVFGDGALLGPAAARSASTSQVARACLQHALAGPGVAVALAGMSRSEHVRRNVALLEAGPLPDDEQQRVVREIERDGGGTTTC